VSHRCDYPAEIEGLAVVTRPLNRRVGGEALGVGGGPFGPGDELGPSELDRDALLAAAPDLIIVREGGVGPGARQIEAAMVGAEVTPQIVALDPITLEGIFHSVTTIGAMTEAEDDAIELVEALREDIGEIEQGVLARHDQGLRPKRVVLLEGLAPLLSSGRWVPEQVRRSGGWDVLGREGEPAAPTSWEEIRDMDPEMLLLAPAGMTVRQAQALWSTTERPEFWAEMDVVRNGRIFFVDPVYFYRPGPRVVDTSPPDSWTPLVEDF
jgi:iron complex transport system substrate-binding protein